MTHQQILLGRMRDFSAWTDNAATPVSLKPFPDEGTVEAHKEEIAAFIRERFPRVCKADPSAWKVGGWKRVELDAAFAALGLAPIEEETHAR